MFYEFVDVLDRLITSEELPLYAVISIVNLYFVLLNAVNVVLEKEKTELEPDWLDHVFTFTQEEPVYLSIFIVPFLYLVPDVPVILTLALIFPVLENPKLRLEDITLFQHNDI